MKIERWTVIAVSATLISLLLFGYFITSGTANLVSANSHKTARIFFVDMGKSTGTLVISPAGKTLLVVAGPSKNKSSKLLPLLDTLGIKTLDYVVVSNYHTDHTSGIAALLNANRIAGVVFDNGSGDNDYLAALERSGVSRQTMQARQVLDLGESMRVTCLAADGKLASGGVIPVNRMDTNSQSISLLVEYKDFDYLLVSDLNQAGSTARVKRTDLATFGGQMAADADVIQFNHYAADPAAGGRLLAYTGAEISFATSSGVSDKYTFFYQFKAFEAESNAVQGVSKVSGQHGTLVLETNGVTNYTIGSFGDGLVLSSDLTSYPIDAASADIAED